MTEASGPGPTPADLAAQLRAAADQVMAGWRAPGAAAAQARTMAMPATVSAQRLATLLQDLAARRAEVQALKSQLQAFDDHLGSLEASLRPMLEWTRTWATMERALGDTWRPPAGGST